MSDSTQPQSIDYFGKGHWLSSIQQQMSLKARRKMFDLCIANWRLSSFAGTRLIDIGSTPDTEWIDSNCMIPWFMSHGIEISLYSIENIQHLSQVFPGVRILGNADESGSLPAKNQEYQGVVASAVIEHVGSRESQVRFVRECGRIGDFLFLTTPNRGHWLEFHTKLPLIHWLPRKLHSMILRILGKKFWASEENLRLIDKKEFLEISKEALGEKFEIQCKTISSLGMASNLILFATRTSH